jgi:hypothetical protein
MEAVSAAQNNGITLRIKILLQEIGERGWQKPTLQKGKTDEEKPILCLNILSQHKTYLQMKNQTIFNLLKINKKVLYIN